MTGHIFGSKLLAAKSLAVAAGAALTLFSTAPSFAATLVDISGATNAGVVKVFGSGGNQVGNVVTGVVDGTTTVVEFGSTTSLKLTGSGYAQIGASVNKATFSDFNVSLADPLLGFSALEFNGQAQDNVYADILVTFASGATESILNVLFDQGENKYRIFTLTDDLITNLAFTGYTSAAGNTLAGFDQFKHFDVAVSPISAVPEPATWGMMIVGFAGAGAMLRRARRRGALAVA